MLNPLDSLDLRELDETTFIQTLADAKVCIEKEIPQVTKCVELPMKDMTQLVEGYLNDKELKEFKILKFFKDDKNGPTSNWEDEHLFPNLCQLDCEYLTARIELEQMGILPTIAKRHLDLYLGFIHTLVAPEHSTANLMNKVTLLVLINGCHSIKQSDVVGIKGTKIATSENQNQN